MISSRLIADLQVIIPLYNEQTVLPFFFKALESQVDLSLDIVFSDAGSTDRSSQLITDYQQQSKHSVFYVDCERGRARQMNRAVSNSSAAVLLFLHADSLWQDSQFLSRALQFYARQAAQHDSCCCVGHFPLQFTHTSCAWIYRYLSAKSALNRRGTIYGDQGMMIQRSDWLQLGGFDESLPILEDVEFADRVWNQGDWLLLPGVLHTSSRRYETEGMWRRQFRNALLLLVYGSGQFDLLNPVMAGYVECGGDSADGYPLTSSPSILCCFSQKPARLSLVQYFRFWYGFGLTVSHCFWLVPYVLSWCLGADETSARRVVNGYDRWLSVPLCSTAVRLILSLGCWSLFCLIYLCRPACWSWHFLRATTSEHKRRT